MSITSGLLFVSYVLAQTYGQYPARRMRYQTGLIAGFLTRTMLDLTPLCTP